MEVVIRIEPSIGAWIGEIPRFLRIHGYKDLHQRKQPCEHAFACVFFYLVTCLADRDTASLKLQMKDGHTIDEQHQIAAPVIQQFGFAGKYGLLNDLIPALPGGNLHPVIDFQADFLAIVSFIIRIVSLNGNGLAIDKAIQLQRRAQLGYLFQNLLHFALSERIIAQTINSAIVIEQYFCPILNQILLRWVLKYGIFPALCHQNLDQCSFKVCFLLKGHGCSPPQTNIFSSIAFLIFCSFSSSR